MCANPQQAGLNSIPQSYGQGMPQGYPQMPQGMPQGYGGMGRQYPGAYRPPRSYMSAPGMENPQMSQPSMQTMQGPDNSDAVARAIAGNDGRGLQMNDNWGVPQQTPGKGIVLAEGSQPMAGATQPAFEPAKTPTYLQGPTAGLFGGATGPAPDPRMVWGMGNAGGTRGWQLQNGWNGYKG